ncbi:hypothetical protein [Cognatishimia activa]|uniref:hypothetical protein n=1 Tax=Cognatishimia activa TaxID=1715691 RepID=UPI00071CC7CC|nr:hypothetical protein [Cognatishimia activa]
MHIRQCDFRDPKQSVSPKARHFRLFELMRQSNACTGSSAPHEENAAAMEAFRDMACASLRF